MGRSRKESAADDFIDVVARLPWQAGIGVAFLTWAVFHWLARTAPNAAAVSPRQIGEFVQRSLVAGFASWLQVIVPILCLIAALVSFLRTRQRAALVATVTRSQTADVLAGMSWREFEALVAEAFRMKGYQVTENERSGPDGGVDLVLRKAGDVGLVQCKQWRALKVGVEIVRELYGVMAARGAAHGHVVTSGHFTEAAQEFARGRNIQLVDGIQLHGMLMRAREAIAHQTATDATKQALARARAADAPRSSDGAASLTCPRCASPMVLRTAARGSRAGGRFLGCSRFPACKGTRDVD